MPALFPDESLIRAAGVRAAKLSTRRWRLLLGLWFAWWILGSERTAAAAEVVSVLPSTSLSAEQSAPFTSAVRQALKAAHVTLIDATELEAALRRDESLRGCTTPKCLAQLGQRLHAGAIVTFSATTPSAATKATYQLQVDYFHVAASAQSASLTSTCASCTTTEVAQSLRELTRQVIAADAARPRGVLAIESTPSDAAVAVDGHDAGRTPYQQPALVGKHSVVLSAAGYLSQQASISVAEARTSRLDIRLVTGSGAATAEESSRPVYKKAWFWVVIGGAAVAVAAVTTGVVLSRSGGPTEPTHAPNHIAF